MSVNRVQKGFVVLTGSMKCILENSLPSTSRHYFVDVLAKLLITLAGFVFGYDGHFEFKDIGK